MRSLTLKLSLAFLAVALTVAGLAAIFARNALVREFDRLVVQQAEENFIADITTYYETFGSWEGVQTRGFGPNEHRRIDNRPTNAHLHDAPHPHRKPNRGLTPALFPGRSGWDHRHQRWAQISSSVIWPLPMSWKMGQWWRWMGLPWARYFNPVQVPELTAR